MFYPLYKSIKDRLVNQVAALKDVQYFNNQYESSIHAEPIALIEFPVPVPVPEISKQTSRAEFTIRIHVISKSVSDVDHSITDAQVKAHDDLTDSVITALKAYVPLYSGAAAGTILVLATAQSNQKNAGWLVTMVDFTTRKLQ